jgi:hypothetical protein
MDKKRFIFWDIKLWGPAKFNLHFGRRKEKPIKIPACFYCACCPFILVSCLAYSSILRMAAISSSETYADFHRTTWCCIREYRTLQLHRCKNLRTKTLDNVQKYKTYLHSYIKPLPKACKITQYAWSTSHPASSRNRCEDLAARFRGEYLQQGQVFHTCWFQHSVLFSKLKPISYSCSLLIKKLALTLGVWSMLLLSDFNADKSSNLRPWANTNTCILRLYPVEPKHKNWHLPESHLYSF